MKIDLEYHYHKFSLFVMHMDCKVVSLMLYLPVVLLHTYYLNTKAI